MEDVKQLARGIILGWMIVSGTAVFAQPADRAAGEKEIVATERSVLGAFAKRDAAAFQAPLAPNAFGIDGMLGVVTAADWLKLMKEMKLESWEIDRTQVHWVSEDTAILTYRWSAKGTFAGQPVPGAAWVSTLYVRRNGKWQPLFHQETIAMDPAAPKK